jgi:hypothetical protein
MALCTAQLQRLKHERRDVQVTRPAAVGDLVHLHEAVARRAPGFVRLGLLLELAVEVGGPLLKLGGERQKEDERGARS